jgi:hypothetical protein
LTTDGCASSVSKIFSYLSDNDCVRILEMLSEQRQPKIRDLGTRKRYYDCVSKLRKARLITKEKRTNDGSRFELTELGWKLHKSILILRHAANLRWKLKAVDALDEKLPFEQRKKIIESIIPDEDIQNMLLWKT